MARSRGQSVGKLVQRFEKPKTATARSELKVHPLAFSFARWWRAVQPHERLHRVAQATISKEQRAWEAAWEQKDEENQSATTATPSQGREEPSAQDALVSAARRFLAVHEPSMSRAIRLDADSEEEERGAREVLAAAKLFARLQRLEASQPDAFTASLGELWTSPPAPLWPSGDSMVLSETDKEEWRLSAEAQLQAAEEVIKEQRELLELEQLKWEEMQKKLHSMEALKGSEERAELQEQKDLLQLEQLQREELEKKLEEQCQLAWHLQLQREELEQKQRIAEEALLVERARVAELGLEVAQHREQLEELEDLRQRARERPWDSLTDQSVDSKGLRVDGRRVLPHDFLEKLQEAAAGEVGIAGSTLTPEGSTQSSLPCEVLSAADLAKHLTARCEVLQRERDAMALEVQETLKLCSRTADDLRAERELWGRCLRPMDS